MLAEEHQRGGGGTEEGEQGGEGRRRVTNEEGPSRLNRRNDDPDPESESEASRRGQDSEEMKHHAVRKSEGGRGVDNWRRALGHDQVG